MQFQFHWYIYIHWFKWTIINMSITY